MFPAKKKVIIGATKLLVLLRTVMLKDDSHFVTMLTAVHWNRFCHFKRKVTFCHNQGLICEKIPIQFSQLLSFFLFP